MNAGRYPEPSRENVCKEKSRLEFMMAGLLSPVDSEAVSLAVGGRVHAPPATCAYTARRSCIHTHVVVHILCLDCKPWGKIGNLERRDFFSPQTVCARLSSEDKALVLPASIYFGIYILHPISYKVSIRCILEEKRQKTVVEESHAAAW